MRSTWVIDLDGVVWLAGEPLPGAADGVAALRAHGYEVLFATNNAEPTLAMLVDRLGRAGIAADKSEVVTSAWAAASMIEPGSRVLACGGPGLLEALGARTNEAVDVGEVEEYDDLASFDVVVVGMTKEFDYDMLSIASMAVRAGARLIGTNEDPTHPTPAGLFPGSGALIAAVAAAAQQPAEMAGKPHEPMIRIVNERARSIAYVIGDRPATDGRLARSLGAPYGLVLSGVISAGHGALDVEPDVEADDLGSLVSRVLESEPGR